MRECVHMHSVLTGTVFFALVLGHRYLPVYDGLRLQDILVMAVGQGLMIALHVVMRRPVALAGGPFDLGEDGGFVEQSQVPLKVEVRAHVLIGPASEALVVPGPRRASVPHTVLLLCGLHRPSAVRRTCRGWRH